MQASVVSMFFVAHLAVVNEETPEHVSIPNSGLLWISPMFLRVSPCFLPSGSFICRHLSCLSFRHHGTGTCCPYWESFATSQKCFQGEPTNHFRKRVLKLLLTCHLGPKIVLSRYTLGVLVTRLGCILKTHLLLEDASRSLTKSEISLFKTKYFYF